MSRPKKAKNWATSVGTYGATVRVSELRPGGNLYLIWLDAAGKQRKKSLGHRDRARGKELALRLAAEPQAGASPLERVPLTIGRLISHYAAEGFHGRKPKYKREALRRLALWREVVGADFEVDRFTHAMVQQTLAQLRMGRLTPSRNQKVSATTCWHYFVALNTALNFATRTRDERGELLLSRNPLHGFRTPKNVSPRQPVATDDYFVALYEAYPHSQFRLALVLALETGHRIGAILQLKWEDVSLESHPSAPYGRIRWRAEADKISNEHTVPISARANEALRTAKALADGGSWVFPSAKNATAPVGRFIARDWLRRAERAAGIEHESGRGWHSFRRRFASRRKHLPDVDVAFAGGWKDTATMKRSYQKADPEGVLAVVNA